MYGFLLTLLVLNGIILGVVILLQAGKGGGLAAFGGGAAASDVLGGRQATTLLTRATWVGGSIFMVLSLILAILSSRSQAPSSVLDDLANPVTTTPQPVLQEGAPALDLTLPTGDEEPSTAEPAPDADTPPPPPPDGNDIDSSNL